MTSAPSYVPTQGAGGRSSSPPDRRGHERSYQLPPERRAASPTLADAPTGRGPKDRAMSGLRPSSQQVVFKNAH